MRKTAITAVLISAVALLSAAAHKAKSVAPVNAGCWTVGDGGKPFRLLLVGESWAAGAKMIPELPLAVSRGLGGRAVQVCGIGYSGANTSKQLIGLKRDFGNSGAAKLMGGKPDAIVILTGINDILQRRGSATYRKDVSRLRDWLAELSTNVAILDLPAININSQLALPYQMKRRFYMSIDGDSEAGLLNAYRGALHGLPIRVLDYDAFGASWDTRPSAFDPAGIHLTPDQFHRLGAYLGDRL